VESLLRSRRTWKDRPRYRGRGLHRPILANLSTSFKRISSSRATAKNAAFIAISSAARSVTIKCSCQYVCSTTLAYGSRALDHQFESSRQ
jgi:hypothetical protein